MKQNVSRLTAAAVCLFFASCQKQSSTAPDTVMFAEASSGQNNAMKTNEEGVPFKGEYTTSFQTLQPPPMFQQRVNGTGNATLLGKSTFTAIANVNRSTTPPFAVAGTRTITAADGDQIFTTFSGISIPVVPGTNRTELQDVIVGGTGRFLNARGRFASSALADQSTSTFTANFDGYVVFANKRR